LIPLGRVAYNIGISLGYASTKIRRNNRDTLRAKGSAVQFLLARKKQFLLGVRQDFLGLPDILIYLFGKLGYGGKFPLPAQEPKQIDLDLFAVNILVEVKDMGLGRKVLFAKGRIITDVQYATVTLALVNNLGNIDPVSRTEIFLGDMEIGGREADHGAAALFADHDLAPDLIIAA